MKFVLHGPTATRKGNVRLPMPLFADRTTLTMPTTSGAISALICILISLVDRSTRPVIRCKSGRQTFETLCFLRSSEILR